MVNGAMTEQTRRGCRHEEQEKWRRGEKDEESFFSCEENVPLSPVTVIAWEEGRHFHTVFSLFHMLNGVRSGTNPSFVFVIATVSSPDPKV